MEHDNSVDDILKEMGENPADEPLEEIPLEEHLKSTEAFSDPEEAVTQKSSKKCCTCKGFWGKANTPFKLLFGVGALIALSVIPLDPNNAKVQYTAGIAILMAIFWVTEAIPLAATALIPLVLFPTFGIVSGKNIASKYVSSIIFVFIGGFLVALAMQRWNLHKRIALKAVTLVGLRPRLLMLIVFTTTWFLSMWISNTATTMAMLPTVLALVNNLESILGRDAVSRYSDGIFLGIAYAASLGGTGTLIGTPPNLVLYRVYELSFPNAPPLTFAGWFGFGFPMATVFLLLMWVVFIFVFPLKLDKVALTEDISPKPLINDTPQGQKDSELDDLVHDIEAGEARIPSLSDPNTEAVTDANNEMADKGESEKEEEFDAVGVNTDKSITEDMEKKKNSAEKQIMQVFRSEYGKLGPLNREEIVMLVDFLLLALLWMFRANIDVGAFVIPGWSNIFPESSYLDDGTVAVVMSLVLFFVPSREVDAKGKRIYIMSIDIVKSLPWDLVLLFGGGFALAEAFMISGLSAYLGNILSAFGQLHVFWVMLIVTFITKFITEFTSNTATAQVLLPVFASMAVAVKVHPLLIMIAGTMACSLAFMMPVATPPNLIVFSSGKLTIKKMALTGLVMNIFATFLTTLGVYFYAPVAFGFSVGEFPSWAV